MSASAASALRLLTGLAGEVDDGSARPYTRREVVLRLTAALAVICGLIHIGAGVDHFDEFALYTLVFSGLAAAQLAWAALLVWRPSTAWLTLGCALQLGVVALWVVSRTSGVPIAPKAWVPEQIGVADAVETVCELVTVVAAIALLLQARSRLARRLLVILPSLLLAVVVVGALLGTGAHAG
jgi:hypothetical protein